MKTYLILPLSTVKIIDIGDSCKYDHLLDTQVAVTWDKDIGVTIYVERELFLISALQVHDLPLLRKKYGAFKPKNYHASLFGLGLIRFNNPEQANLECVTRNLVFK